MKTWYRAVCDEHKEMCTVMVSNPKCTEHYLGKNNKEIQAWLERHSNCNLKLVHRDEDLEKLLGNYKDI